ncbi:hypothetical protein BT69DRAFT_1403751 [Atractiella rhizophila]|nr:hypothetical protein BT69DRAFT_1403751 [Atractiella rhizophila]
MAGKCDGTNDLALLVPNLLCAVSSAEIESSFQLSPLVLLPTAIIFPSSRSAVPSWVPTLSKVLYAFGLLCSLSGVATGKWNDATQLLVFDFTGSCIAARYLVGIEEVRIGKKFEGDIWGILKVGPGRTLFGWLTDPLK